MSRKEVTKVEGNVIGRIGQRGDEGKARPEGGSSKVGEKWGWIPAAAGKKGKHHPTTDLSTIDGGVTDRGKTGLHGHHYPGRPYPKGK